jgi:hypothetical protein
MTKLDEMWVEFEKHQSIADDDRHGDTWSDMCRLRTVEACRAAADAAYVAATEAANYAAYAAYAAANYAAYAADAASNAAADAAEYWMQEAIKRINHAIKLAEKQND